MGYQVGHICYSSKQQAENAYFSQVLPQLSTDGKLYQMIYTPAGWIFEGHQVNAHLPPCDPVENFQDGMLIGWGIFAIAATLWGIQLLHKKLLK